METDLRNFLLIYDLNKGKLETIEDLGSDGEAAALAYSECEEEYRDREGIEIVLVGADSEETIRKTHSHYFDTGDRETTDFPSLVTR